MNRLVGCDEYVLVYLFQKECLMGSRGHLPTSWPGGNKFLSLAIWGGRVSATRGSQKVMGIRLHDAHEVLGTMTTPSL